MAQIRWQTRHPQVQKAPLLELSHPGQRLIRGSDPMAQDIQPKIAKSRVRLRVSRANVLSFLSLNLARLASSATQLFPIRRQLSSACALMQAGGQPGKLAGLQPEQSSSARATPGRYLKRAKRAPRPPWIVNEVSSVQVRELDRAIFVVMGQRVTLRSPDLPCVSLPGRTHADRVVGLFVPVPLKGVASGGDLLWSLWVVRR